jgi:F420-non-reducing hydrogenase iron-sulfur subunit
MEKENKLKITLFHCINSFRLTKSFLFGECEVKVIQMPCSSMVKDIFILKAFEAGADAVLVFVCPENSCRYVEGSIRAKKRVQRIKELLDEIGMDGKRQLSIFNVITGDNETAETIIKNTIRELKEME